MPRILYSPDTISNTENPVVGTPQTKPEQYEDIKAVTPETFGGVGPGQALQKAGTEINQGATQLWDTGKELQVIKNTTDANNQGTEGYLNPAEDLINKQRALKGDEYNRQLPQTKAALMQLYKDAGNQLNPLARNVFDAQYRRFLVGHLDSLDSGSVEQQKVADDAATKGTSTAILNNSQNNYNDDKLNEKNSASLVALREQEWLRTTGGGIATPDGKGKMPPPEITADLKNKVDTEILQGRIISAINKNELGEAQRLKDKYGNAGVNQEALQPVFQHLKTTLDAQGGLDAWLRAKAAAAGTQPSDGGPRAMDTTGTGVGHTAPKTDRIAFYRDYAARKGLNPDAVIDTIAGEGLNNYTGDHGTSFGDFQLHIGGGMGDAALAAGVDIRDPNKWKEQGMYAIDQMAANKDKGEMWYGGPNAGEGGQWHGASAWAAQNFNKPGARSNAAPTSAPNLVPGGALHTGATPASTPTAKPAFAAKPIAIGDSIAHQQITQGDIGGDQGPGHNDPGNLTNSAAIGRSIDGNEKYLAEKLKNNPDLVRGQTVYLSSGASNTFFGGRYNNDTAQLVGIERMIQMINAAGGRVTLMGVGNYFNNTNLNKDLAAIAARNHAAFGGHLIGTEKDSTGIHPNAAATRSQLDAATRAYFGT